MRDARPALDGIIDLSRDRGIELFVVLDGSASMVATTPVLRLYYQHLKSRGIEAYTISEDLARRHDLHISMIDSHLNAEGNQILADALFGYLLPLLPPRVAQGVADPAAPGTK